jgi:DNA-binding LytR/AlgR family response regulator
MDKPKVSALVVEDDPVIAADLVWLLKDFGYAPFPPVESAEEARLLLDNVKPDIVLMDVSIEGGVDGIDLAQEIQGRCDVPIVFLTAHHDRKTMDRIKAIRASAYLVKPLQGHNLQAALELALYNHSHRQLTNPEPEEKWSDRDQALFIKVKNQLRRFELNEISCLEAADNYAFLHTPSEKHLISHTLKQLEEKLPADFVRVHRSFIVNMRAVDGIEEDVILVGKRHIPLGKTYRDDFMQRIRTL